MKNINRHQLFAKEDSLHTVNTIEMEPINRAQANRLGNAPSASFFKDRFSFRDNRIQFAAAHHESRSINLSGSNKLLDEYMSRPISAFSIRSFYDQQDFDLSKPRNSKRTLRRRWLVRKLTIDEALHDGILNMDPDDDRYFRLAVPLMPLLGIDLTPVIDFEVLSVRSSKQAVLYKLGPKTVQLRSVRLSLLSKDDEVNNAMAETSLTKVEIPRPTKVSMNQNIREIGINAIDMAGKIEDIIKPYFSFDAEITWSEGHQIDANRRDAHISIKASTKASFVWDQKVIHPLVMEKISSIALKRAMKLGLQQLLSQIERDFKDWAIHQNT
jgi:hypothetical protein